MINTLWLEAWRRSPVGLAVTGDPAALDLLWPTLVRSVDDATFVSPAMELPQLSAARGTAIIAHGEAFSPEAAAALGTRRVLVRCSDVSQLPAALADACPLIAFVSADLPELLSRSVDLRFSPTGSCAVPLTEIVDMLTVAGLSAHSLDVPACQFAAELAGLTDRDHVLQGVAEWVIAPRVGDPQQLPPPPPPPAEDESTDEPEQEPDSSDDTSKQHEAEEQQAQDPDEETPVIPQISRVGKRGGRVRGPRWSGRNGAEELSRSRGRTRRVVRMRDRSETLAVLPTLAAAAPWQPMRRVNRPSDTEVVLTRDDLRVRQRIARGGGLAIIVVDASGSMGLGAIRAAKATALGVLEQGYRNRDRVAIIVARGREAYVGLPETRSISRARDSIRTLPTGGGTPLASALLKASELASRHEPARVRVVVLTDGNANVGLSATGKAAARADALRALAQLRHNVADVQFLPLGSRRRRGDPLAWLTSPQSSPTPLKVNS